MFSVEIVKQTTVISYVQAINEESSFKNYIRLRLGIRFY